MDLKQDVFRRSKNMQQEDYYYSKIENAIKRYE